MSNDFIKQLIKEEIDNIIDEDMIPEGGYSKLIRTLAGMEENIDSVGIITAENPMAEDLPSYENKSRNKSLAADLRELGYGFYQIEGKYGSVEKPYVIPNIKLKDLLDLGKKYKQESVIHTEKTENGFLARLIYVLEDIPSVARQTLLPLPGNKDDFYSSYKGRKFQIPFFDDLYKNDKMTTH